MGRWVLAGLILLVACGPLNQTDRAIDSNFRGRFTSVLGKQSEQAAAIPKIPTVQGSCDAASFVAECKDRIYRVCQKQSGHIEIESFRGSKRLNVFRPSQKTRALAAVACSEKALWLLGTDHQIELRDFSFRLIRTGSLQWEPHLGLPYFALIEEDALVLFHPKDGREVIRTTWKFASLHTP